MDRQNDGWIDGQMDGYEWMNGQIDDGWMDGWRDGWMNDWIDG